MFTIGKREETVLLYILFRLSFSLTSSLIPHPLIFQFNLSTIRKYRPEGVWKKEKEWHRRKLRDDIQLHHQILTFFGQSSPYNYKSEKIRAHHLNGRKYSTCRINFSWSHDLCRNLFPVTSNRFFRMPHRDADD